MATKLGVYNAALRLCGQRPLHSSSGLTEATPARYALDSVWSEDYADAWLEEADWTFALDGASLGKDDAVEPDFGYSNTFELPSEMVRLSGVYEDSLMTIPHRQYRHEGNWIDSNLPYIYIQYVDRTKGEVIADWSPKFVDFVAAGLALKIAPVLHGKVDTDRLFATFERIKHEAVSANGLSQPSRSLPRGSWASARIGASNGIG